LDAERERLEAEKSREEAEKKKQEVEESERRQLASDISTHASPPRRGGERVERSKAKVNTPTSEKGKRLKKPQSKKENSAKELQAQVKTEIEQEDVVGIEGLPRAQVNTIEPSRKKKITANLEAKNIQDVVKTTSAVKSPVKTPVVVKPTAGKTPTANTLTVLKTPTRTKPSSFVKTPSAVPPKAAVPKVVKKPNAEQTAFWPVYGKQDYQRSFPAKNVPSPSRFATPPASRAHSGGLQRHTTMNCGGRPKGEISDH